MGEAGRSENGHMLCLLLLSLMADQVFSNCPSIEIPVNGKLRYQQTVGSLAFFGCDFGYERVGSRTLTCQADSTWSDNPPVCRIKDCGPLPNITNGYVLTIDGTTYTKMAYYHCHNGYAITQGHKARFCNRYGIWNRIEAGCTDQNECQQAWVCHKNALCTNTVGSFTCTCHLGFIGDGKHCTECLPREVPLYPNYGVCKPVLLDGTLNGYCKDCHQYSNEQYDWKLGSHSNSSDVDQDCVLLDTIYSTRTGRSADFSCGASDCSNILNGATGDQLTLVMTVTVDGSLGSNVKIKSSTSTDVFVRKLPISDEDLQCSLLPETDGQSFVTEYHVNCTSLHKRYDLFYDGISFDYKSSPRIFKKQLSIEAEGTDMIEFVGPVSQAFALPPGDPVILELTVLDCNNVIMFQVMERKVLTEFYTKIDSGDFSVVYSSEEVFKDPDNFHFTEMRVSVVSKLKESNINSSDEVKTATELLNIVTERGDWMNDVDKKTSTVELYTDLSKAFVEIEEDISMEEVANMSGVLLKGVSTTLDHFTEVENNTEADSANMTVLMNKMMDSLDNVCEASLKKLPITEEPTVLYSSQATMLFVQNTNNTGLGGTKLSVCSNGTNTSDTSFHFPDVMKINNTNKVSLQMVYHEHNPFVWENTSLDVTAPVLTITLKDQSGHKMEVDHLKEPIIYVTPRKTSIIDIGHINISYTRSNESQEDYKSQMLQIQFSFERGETKMFNIILPNNISNVWVYGPTQSPPDITSGGFLIPQQWKQMQASLVKHSFIGSFQSSNTGSNLYISAEEYFFGNHSSYDMYLGVMLDFKDKVVVGLLQTLVAECSNLTIGNCNSEVQLPFSMELDSLFCVFWKGDIHDWSTQGCEVYPMADSKHLECHCDHLSAFSSSSAASDFLVAPVMISIQDIMLFSTFFENPVVITVIIMVWVIYFFAVHWARRFDKKDIEQIGVLNCEDNSPSETYLYLVCVMTGWWQQAGTTANVYMYITGLSGSSSKKRLSTTARLCFQNGFEDWFLFSTETNLGALQTVTIWHDNAGTSPDWYLNQVFIKDFQSKLAWNFIYNDWLAVDKGDLRQSTTTIMAVSEEDMKFKQKYNFALISSRNLRDGHLWVSIVSKPPQSSFTRVQRLTCGLSLLLTMMLTNIMFYGLPPDDPDQQLEAGGFSFNLKQIIIGIESSIIMFPVNFIVLQLFIRIKPRPTIQRKITIDSQGKRQTGPSYKERLLGFYKKLLKSGTFNQDKLFRKLCLPFKDKSIDDIGDLLVEKCVNTYSRNVIQKALKLESQRKNSIINFTKDPYQSKLRSCASEESMASLPVRPYSPTLRPLRTAQEAGQSAVSYASIDEVSHISLTEFGDIHHNTESLNDNDSHSTYNLNKLTVQVDGQSKYTLNSSTLSENLNTSNCCDRRKCKESGGSSDVSSGSIKGEQPLLKRQGVKKVLPWWFLYISWFIVIASCLTCSFFAMLYGLKYGYARSVEWIVSFLTGFIQGVLVEQPVKVIGMAVVLALILHKQADIEAYGPDVELAEDEEYISEIKIEEYKHQPFVEPLSGSLLTRIRDRLRLQWLMDVTVRDLILYILYLTVLLVIVHGHNNHHTSYLNSQTVYQLIVKPADGISLLEVGSPEDFFSYMKETFAPVAESLAETQRDEISANGNHYLLGFYRIRQVRTKEVDCPTSLSPYLVTRCVGEYFIGDEDTDSYTEYWSNVDLWQDLIDYNDTDSYYWTNLVEDKAPDAWTYRESWNLKTLPYTGVHATYPGGGYVQLLRNNATDTLTELEEKGWIDDHTRAVFVECTLYNPNVDIFSLVILLFEVTPVGVMYPKYEILSTNLHRYSSDSQQVITACEGVFVCFNILFIYIELKKYRKVGKREYLKDIWSIFELLQITLSFVVIGLFIKRILTVSSTLKELKENDNSGKFINFHEAFFWNFVLEYAMAFLVAIAMIKAIKLIRFNARVQIINATLSKVRSELFGFFLILMIISIAFTHCGYLMFGCVLNLYKNVHYSLYTNILLILGKEIGLELREARAILGPLFMVTYVICVSYLAFQICITILNTGRIIARFELAGKNKFELKDYIIAKIKRVTARK